MFINKSIKDSKRDNVLVIFLMNSIYIYKIIGIRLILIVLEILTMTICKKMYYYQRMYLKNLFLHIQKIII